jgi:DNA primase
MSFLEAVHLPDGQKEQLCRQLLTEFGVTDIRQHDDELVHGCLISAYHQDQVRNPTASLNFHKLTYNCLGCGSHGGLLWFIATVRGVQSNEARRWLEIETGTGGQIQELAKLLHLLDALNTRQETRAPIPRYSTRVLESWDFVHPYMTTGDPEVGLEGRGIPVETLERFRIGWDPEKDRIVFPHFWKGALVGWQTRRIWNDGTEKYKNSPDFPKDETLYNAYPKGPRGPSRIVVVESNMSVLRHVHAMPMSSTFGAKITDRQLWLLEGYEEIVIWMDNDKAGWKATERLGEHLGLGARGLVRVVISPYAADPGDLPTEVAEGMVDEAVPYDLWRRPEPESLIRWEEVA